MSPGTQNGRTRSEFNGTKRRASSDIGRCYFVKQESLRKGVVFRQERARDAFGVVSHWTCLALFPRHHLFSAVIFSN